MPCDRATSINIGVRRADSTGGALWGPRREWGTCAVRDCDASRRHPSRIRANAVAEGVRVLDDSPALTELAELVECEFADSKAEPST